MGLYLLGFMASMARVVTMGGGEHVVVAGTIDSSKHSIWVFDA